MTLVLRLPTPLLAPAVAKQLEPPVIVQNRRARLRENLQTLLREARRSLGDIGDSRDGVVGERERDEEVVARLERRSGKSITDSIDGFNWRPRDERQRVDEMADLTERAPTALGEIVDPVVRRDRPRAYAVARGDPIAVRVHEATNVF